MLPGRKPSFETRINSNHCEKLTFPLITAPGHCLSCLIQDCNMSSQCSGKFIWFWEELASRIGLEMQKSESNTSKLSETGRAGFWVKPLVGMHVLQNQQHLLNVPHFIQPIYERPRVWLPVPHRPAQACKGACYLCRGVEGRWNWNACLHILATIRQAVFFLVHFHNDFTSRTEWKGENVAAFVANLPRHSSGLLNHSAWPGSSLG